MTFTFPAALVSKHFAIVGETGSGKSSTSKLMIEQLAAEGARVCILDTIKSDWWGITSSADGKKPGLPFTILGGPRGHMPLSHSAGAALGQLVADGALPLSILDMADFAAGGVQHFFADFAEQLFRSMQGVLHLVIEEAHEVAPKERAGFGAENMSLYWAKKLATASRSKGIRLIVATQRVQKLHNDMLSSCAGLAALRLGFPPDQKPIVDWLKVHQKDAAIRREVEDSLAHLPDGTGWLCSGPAHLFEKVAFPKFSTFDNSRTPDAEAAKVDVKTAPIDLKALQAIVGDAVKDAETSAPAKLKAKIAELEKKLAGMSQNTASGDAEKRDSEAALNEAWSDGFADGKIEGDKQGYERGKFDGFTQGWEESRRLTQMAIAEELDSFPDRLRNRVAQVFTSNIAAHSTRADSLTTDKVSAVGPIAFQGPAAERDRRAKESSAPRPVAPEIVAGGCDASLTKPQRELLRALAWWNAMGHDAPTRVQIAAIVGWSPKSSNLRDRLSELSKLGLVTYPVSGKVSLTSAGGGAAPAADLSKTIVESLRARLTTPQIKLFDILLAKPREAMTRNALAIAVGWSPASSNLRDRLSELSSLSIVFYPAKGQVALQPWVTEKLEKAGT